MNREAGASSQTTLERVYDFVSGDEDGRVCEAIPDRACEHVPRNFALNSLDGTVTRLGDQLGSPELVLPWLLAALGAPAFMAGLLVPLRNSLALLPQLTIAGRIRAYEKRKWFWVAGGAGFGLAFLLMVPVTLLLPGVWAGAAIVLLLALGSVSRGVSSVAFKDVLAKTIPRGRRGILLAVRATTGGLLTLAAGFLMRQYVTDGDNLVPYLVLLAATAGLWFVGSALVALMVEEPGETAGGRNTLAEARAAWHVWQEQKGFRHFTAARGLLLSVELVLPFYALFVRQQIDGRVADLGLFVVAAGLAAVLSSPLWGRFADRSSRLVMLWSGVLAAVAGAAALLLGALPAAWQTAGLYAPVFLVAGFAQAGLRLGRKTYLVDAPPAVERPLYVALHNTLIGVLFLASGLFGFLVDWLGLNLLIALMVALMVAGALMSWRMPEAEKMVRGVRPVGSEQ
jgi:hypothetical protein